MPAARPNSQHSPTPPASQADGGVATGRSPQPSSSPRSSSHPRSPRRTSPTPTANPRPRPRSSSRPTTRWPPATLPPRFKILTGLNTQTPNNPQGLYDLGLTLEALAPETPNPTAPDPKAPTAEFYYRHSITANPLFAAPHVALGLLLARSARPVEARSELLTATQLPDAAPALKARALRALAKLALIRNHQQASNSTAASAELLAALNLTPEAPEDIRACRRDRRVRRRPARRRARLPPLPRP